MAKGVNELRKNPLGQVAVITAVRASRPHDASVSKRIQKTVLPEKCFFCPGNEHLTPPEIERVEVDGKWAVRCFPNKFPAFARESKKAYGRHEVIVETNDHQKTLSDLSEAELLPYLQLLKRRLIDAAADPKIAYVSLFKNEGKAAGASLEHSHTQLVGMPFVPESVRKFSRKAEKFQKIRKQCAKNVFFENTQFFAFCPKASRFHFESWIVPLFKASSLLEMDDSQLSSLAGALKKALVATDAVTGYAPYNIVFQNSLRDNKEFPFHIQILPRLSTWAGFELGTGVVMVSELPEETAKAFREVLKA